jgi:hypothetical protein
MVASLRVTTVGVESSRVESRDGSQKSEKLDTNLSTRA